MTAAGTARCSECGCTWLLGATSTLLAVSTLCSKTPQEGLAPMSERAPHRDPAADGPGEPRAPRAPGLPGGSYHPGESCRAKGLEHKYETSSSGTYLKCGVCGSTKTLLRQPASIPAVGLSASGSPPA